MTGEPLHKGDARENVNEISVLILHNDDHNSFDHVITSLVEVCGHDEIQAEQCAVIAHFRGRCDIRRGNRDLLSKMQNTLRQRDLTVVIE